MGGKIEENRSVNGKEWEMKHPLVGRDLKNVSLITAETKERNRPEGRRKDALAKSLII